VTAAAAVMAAVMAAVVTAVAAAALTTTTILRGREGTSGLRSMVMGIHPALRWWSARYWAVARR